MKYGTSTTLALFLLVGSAGAAVFKPGIHIDITRLALGGISKTVGGEILSFTSSAIEEVADANYDTDVGPGFFSSEFHFDNELFFASSTRLRTLKESVITEITSSDPNGAKARESLGTALHTLQDFYAHSNWVELGNAAINGCLGRNVIPNPNPVVATCPVDPEMLPAGGGPILTTGYYIGLLGCGRIPLPGKCYHGGPITCDGINKDDPSRAGHAQARNLATLATTDYVNQILTDPRVCGNAPAIKCLFGITSGSLGMVIDDTGSMGPEIAAVKAAVTVIINFVIGTDLEPKQYLLERYGDPDVGPPFVTTDPMMFLGQVNALSPSGGGDCPELTNDALLEAIGASRSGSTLFLFTDASSKAPLKAPLVVASAIFKRIKISPILTGTCSPIDQAYVDIAQQTGGQLFLLDASELEQAFDLVQPQVEGDFVSIMLAEATLAGGQSVFSVPIDSSVSKAVFSVSLSSVSSVTLFSPSGPVNPGDPGVTFSNLSTGCIVTVEGPEAGSWTLQVSGSGELTVAVNGTSSLDVRSVDLVELVNPVHEGYAPEPGEPLVGAGQTVRAVVLGTYASAEFELVDSSGALLKGLSLLQGNEFGGATDFVGSMTVPSDEFRVAASGIDLGGFPFRRLFPPLFSGQTFDIQIDPDSVPSGLVPGKVTVLQLNGLNDSAKDSFQMSVADNLGFAGQAQPSVLNLSTGEEATVSVPIVVPVGTQEGTEVVVSATMTSISNPGAVDSTSIALRVTKPTTAHGISPVPFVESRIWSVSSRDNSLRRVVPSTAQTEIETAIQLTGQTVTGANGIARHPTTGEVYALLKVAGQFGRELVTLDIQTGLATSIGDTGDRFAGLAFDSTGQLYGVTGDGASVPETLYAVSAVDASTALVMALGNGDDGEAISFGTGDVLYHVSGFNDLVFESIDLVSSMVMNIPLPIGLPMVEPLALVSVEADPSTNFFWAAGTPTSDLLYGLSESGSVDFIGFLDHQPKGLMVLPFKSKQPTRVR